MKEFSIQLTRGYSAIVDFEDSDLGNIRWHVKVDANTAYAVRKPHEIGNRGKQYLLGIHKVILERVLGRPLIQGELADHINGDGLDNRRSNLRLATFSENVCNSKMSSLNTSGYRGVTWNKKVGKWQAQIGKNRKRYHLGVYETAIEAYQAYLKAAKELHGEFVRSQT